VIAKRTVASLGLCALVACNVALGLEEAEIIPSLAVGGGVQSCTADVDCEDDNPCTTDHCAESLCAHDPLDGEAPFAQQIAGDCARIVCSAGQASSLADNADLPEDMQECTEDLCQAGMPVNTPREGATCAQDGGKVCNGEGECVECISNEQCTQPEECFGGGVPYQCGCTPRETCATEGMSCGSLQNDCGQLQDCDNTVMDQTETGIDCGGPTIMLGGTCDVRCKLGDSCVMPSDCGVHMSQPLTCVNMACCLPNNAMCAAPTDCCSGNCPAGTCN
jgi:hypothetical protein